MVFLQGLEIQFDKPQWSSLISEPLDATLYSDTGGSANLPCTSVHHSIVDAAFAHYGLMKAIRYNRYGSYSSSMMFGSTNKAFSKTMVILMNYASWKAWMRNYKLSLY